MKKQFKGNLGLFLVCAELSKWNLIALPTSRNTEGYDIVVLNPDNNKSVGIQVKCTDKKDFPIFSSYWRDYQAKISNGIKCDFVFVDISNLNIPEYIVVSQEKLKSVLQSVIEDYRDRYLKKHEITWEQMLESEHEKDKKPNLWAIKLQYLESYKNKWETIIDRLK